MNYYSEEEIRTKFRRLGFDEDAISAYINNMTPVELITMFSTDRDSPPMEYVLKQSSDRERIRMELWAKAAGDQSFSCERLTSIEIANNALAAFDKQFPK